VRATDTERAMPPANVEIGRRILDAYNRRDKATYIALCDPEMEWVPPAEWPEAASIRGPEAIWQFIVEVDEPWERGVYELVEIIDGTNDRIVAHLRRTVRGKASGVDAEFEYWNVATFRRGKQVRAEWFTGRAEALAAAGL
jgi:ketosteroid isomerase-like protein